MATPRLKSGEVLALPGLPTADASTQALVKADSLEVVHLVLPAGRVMPRHQAPGEITILGLRGVLSLQLDTHRVDIGPGDFIHLAAAEPHAVEALSDASALLTLCLHRTAPH